MTKWTHFTERINERDFDRKVDEYNERGWEIVSFAFYPLAEGGTANYILAVFRSPSLA